MASTVLKVLMAGLIAGSAVAASALPAAAETPNLTAADRGPCRDPWINYAYRTQFNRAPVGRADVGECFIRIYAGGAWNNYDELRDSVVAFQRQLQSRGINTQLAGTVYKFARRTGVVDILFRVAGQVYDAMGQASSGAGRYSLQSTDQQVDLGKGTTMIIR